MDNWYKRFDGSLKALSPIKYGLVYGFVTSLTVTLAAMLFHNDRTWYLMSLCVFIISSIIGYFIAKRLGLSEKKGQEPRQND